VAQRRDRHQRVRRCWWIVTLPLWLTGVGAVLAPVLTSAYLNQRMFRYDALANTRAPRSLSASRALAR